ncbi:hypothetical protein [Bifidobacterium animalis]|uniref:hypothetical protein n=1 Tax=Bifidobacterium animalis TaxID=28025 RepID=UPI001C3E9C51|nr:hypothetical protein [Bifidobacterium animalis]MCR1996226.1 hypothetical protein [Bifidobacterium animalis subsp. animalis]
MARSRLTLSFGRLHAASRSSSLTPARRHESSTVIAQQSSIVFTPSTAVRVSDVTGTPFTKSHSAFGLCIRCNCAQSL